MRAFTAIIELDTRGETDIIDLTPRLVALVQEQRMAAGLVTVFVAGSTAGITTIEFESGVIDDLKKAIERLAPRSISYAHDNRWGDGNGYSHVRAALLGPSLTIPIREGRLALGTWQQVVLCDFDNRARHRQVQVHFLGE